MYNSVVKLDQGGWKNVLGLVNRVLLRLEKKMGDKAPVDETLTPPYHSVKELKWPKN